MKVEDIRSVAVIGAGSMGNQIAEILSRIGHCNVKITDMNEEILARGIERIKERLEKFFVSKGKMTTEEKEEVIGRILARSSVEEAVEDVDFAIEAVIENLEVKKDVFRKMEAGAPAHSIFASNTSYQSITEIASVTKRAEKVVGTHFFNPVAVMKLVEVVRGARTSEDTINVSCELMSKLEKEPVVCKDSSYGFLANRAYTAMVIEAVQMLWERAGSPEDIDKALKLGYNLPMGPLELLDFTGGWAILEASEKDAMKEVGPEKGHLHPVVRIMRRAGYNSIYEFWRDSMASW